LEQRLGQIKTMVQPELAAEVCQIALEPLFFFFFYLHIQPRKKRKKKKDEVLHGVLHSNILLIGLFMVQILCG
jgi:preprotein translocase subunit YajC